MLLGQRGHVAVVPGEQGRHGNQLGGDVFEVPEGPGHGDGQKSEGRGADGGEVRAPVSGDAHEREHTIYYFFK